jgi:hypothetical protein
MLHDAAFIESSSPVHRRLCRLSSGLAIIDGVNLTSLTAILASAGLAILATGCGSSTGAHVARLSAKAPPTSASSSARPSQASGALAFSRCMRSHGVPTYPDPTTPGRLPKKTLQELGVSSSAFQSGQRACIHLVPNGGRPTQSEVQLYRGAMLTYARCIRTHGVPNMPDPDRRGHLDIGPGTSVDVDSPKFEAAYQTCKSKLAP